MEKDDNGNSYVEMVFPGATAELISDKPTPKGYLTKLRVYLAAKAVVVEREIGALTPIDYTNNAAEVEAAIIEELKTWLEHCCIERRRRRGATNILDVRWVGTWKKVKSKTDPELMVRIIRMRMTLRGCSRSRNLCGNVEPNQQASCHLGERQSRLRAGSNRHQEDIP